jgi:hypothetical protein
MSTTRGTIWLSRALVYILLTDEIGKWAGDIIQATLPDKFLVDYVRVYDLMETKQSGDLLP